MKACLRCGFIRADEEFSRDRSRRDGLANVCRDCNAEKCRQYYSENRERQIARSVEYKALHGSGPRAPGIETATAGGEPARRKRAERPSPPAPLTEYIVVKFSEEEWLACLLLAQAGGFGGQDAGRDYVRSLVQAAIAQSGIARRVDRLS